MKKFSIILNIVLVLVSLFFIVYANIQTKFAKEQAQRAESLYNENVALTEQAGQEAANARDAEARATMSLEATMNAEKRLKECQNSK